MHQIFRFSGPDSGPYCVIRPAKLVNLIEVIKFITFLFFHGHDLRFNLGSFC